ncbi:hypothetical protein OG994_23405 [Micromonospora globbae]|uniref:Uncharacterized protein n=1 Tax=Micromonospora globbae TaxID=1894969 RepID=A0ABZ1S3B3_9ACTN|nr:hypothetical protein [Micromonospora globbae]
MSLTEMVRSYLDDSEVTLLPADPATEVRRNTWSYSVSPTSVDVPQVVAALNFVADELRQRLAGHTGSGTFYAWYDAQAGQLRCSLSSQPAESLPFGAPYLATTDAAKVVRMAAGDRHRGVVLWGNLADVDERADPDAPDDELAAPFPVWCAEVP